MHYKEFARILGRHRADEKMINDFMEYFESDNPRFDKKRFLEAIAEEKLERATIKAREVV
jgi:hypothetical protein